MTHNFPELHRQVVFGESGGQIIWQPRIGCWYTDKKFAGEAFPAPYTGMSLYEIYRELDCSARLYEYNGCFVRVEHPAVHVTERELNDTLERLRGQHTIIITTHRHGLLINCDVVAMLAEGRLLSSGSYSDLYCGEPDFKRLVDAGRW